MRSKARRIFAGIVWVIGSVIAWGIVCNTFVFVVFIYLGNQRHVKLPEAITTVYKWTAFAGIVALPVMVAALAVHSKLPWTGEHSSTGRGFPVEPSGPSGIE